MATKKKTGCIDHLTNLKNYIREGFIKKEHTITIFFDLEKAYDTTWKFGIIKDLYDLKLRGRLPKFIKNFLTDRTFHSIRFKKTKKVYHKAAFYQPLFSTWK